MDKAVKLLSMLLGAVLTAGLIGAAVSRSVAVDQVRPVENRVTTLEAERREDAKKLDELRADVKELLRRVR